MVLRHSGGLEAEAKAIEDSVTAVLDKGLRTADIARGAAFVKTGEMGHAVLDELKTRLK
jgi:3-isopropylmalate dehydrogenase